MVDGRLRRSCTERQIKAVRGVPGGVGRAAGEVWTAAGTRVSSYTVVMSICRYIHGFAFGLTVLAATSSQAASAPIVGVETIIDGDTIQIHSVRIWLHGIDAPESRQLCTRPTGERWRCGQQASLALSDQIGRLTVSCDLRDTDRYGRTVAVCSSRGVDLNGWLVIQGWAVAYWRYSRDYVRAEDQARAGRRGVWSGQFDVPWEWRAAQRSCSVSSRLAGDATRAPTHEGGCRSEKSLRFIGL